MTAEEAKDFLGVIRIIDGDKLCEALKLAEEALEKQIPKKPNRYCHLKLCPVCNSEYITRNLGTYKEPMIYSMKYCNNCGQAIDWSEED